VSRLGVLGTVVGPPIVPGSALSLGLTLRLGSELELGSELDENVDPVSTQTESAK
jgi:hypothetical protein